MDVDGALQAFRSLWFAGYFLVEWLQRFPMLDRSSSLSEVSVPPLCYLDISDAL